MKPYFNAKYRYYERRLSFTNYDSGRLRTTPESSGCSGRVRVTPTPGESSGSLFWSRNRTKNSWSRIGVVGALQRAYH